MFMFFINSALAETAQEAPSFQNFMGSLVPLLIFVVIFYFLLIRPQQKRQQQHEKEVSELKPNDKVLTSGGIYAKVVKIKEKTLVVEIADGVEVEVLPNSVNPIFEETPVKTEKKVEKKETKKRTTTKKEKK